MISPEYLEVQRQMHREKEAYGKYSAKWAPSVMALCAEAESHDVLDYGCGKAELNLNLPFSIKRYDPAIPKYEERPEPADIVVCTDVLEHVEEEFVDEVLDDLERLTKRFLLFEIATCKAKKHLPDGRNAHITIHPVEWWMEKLRARWDVVEMVQSKDGCNGVMEVRREH